MSRIEWNKAGERFYETGVDRGVFYPRFDAGVAWNGLVAVNESISGGEMEALYYDGVKIGDLVAAEDFSATIESYSHPVEFSEADGTRQISPGLYVTQQVRKKFGFSYRTMIGNDLVGATYGYKIHLVYNCTASPSARNNTTISESVNPPTRSWTLYTVPAPGGYFKPTAHVVIDSTKVSESKMAAVENMLYGTSNANAFLPSIAQLSAALA